MNNPIHSKRSVFNSVTLITELTTVLTLMFMAARVMADPPKSSSWSLTFSDEFNEPTLDTSKWTSGYVIEKTGPGSWADPGNVRFSNGHYWNDHRNSTIKKNRWRPTKTTVWVVCSDYGNLYYC